MYGAWVRVLNVVVGTVVLAGLELVLPHWIWNYNPFYGDIALWHFPNITTASNVRKCHTTFWPSNVQYPHWSMRPLCLNWVTSSLADVLDKSCSMSGKLLKNSWRRKNGKTLNRREGRETVGKTLNPKPKTYSNHSGRIILPCSTFVSTCFNRMGPW